ncbi:hypothetical protein P0W64_16910 [Tsukamurella sp. 8F]|uniref:hypothetical protein n=1 Tax=unclassified Tsukamurella TaxID=2633480 RepID=UPI0023B9C80F|nr:MULTISPECIES: hypothetical protein [unclassified Tsukamurella]MDF0532453.1 hypothetical protein [Tsukamurella sp. 8J]MDF0588464.1 hypothetical protein [Tsukamurella sp. 8F]
MRGLRVPVWGQVALIGVVVVALLYALGAARPLAPRALDGDRLGPEPGQDVAEYVATAGQSLRAAPATGPRWALVSFAAEWTTSQVWERIGADLADRVRIGRLLMRVPVPRVQTPTVPVAPGQSAAGLDAANVLAALEAPSLVAPGERGTAIGSVSATRFRARAASVVGVVVYGTGEDLRTLGGAHGVRAVQVMPDGSGRFGLTPLLPEFGVRATPGPDDGPVPSR